jgi:hypothetical protein
VYPPPVWLLDPDGQMVMLDAVAALHSIGSDEVGLGYAEDNARPLIELILSAVTEDADGEAAFLNHLLPPHPDRCPQSITAAARALVDAAVIGVDEHGGYLAPAADQ